MGGGRGRQYPIGNYKYFTINIYIPPANFHLEIHHQIYFDIPITHAELYFTKYNRKSCWESYLYVSFYWPFIYTIPLLSSMQSDSQEYLLKLYLSKNVKDIVVFSWTVTKWRIYWNMEKMGEQKRHHTLRFIWVNSNEQRREK